MRDRKPYCLVRGDVFKNKVFSAFLHWVELLPVQRLNFEGYAGFNAKEANGKTFEAAEDTASVMDTTLACLRGLADCLDGSVERGVIYGKGVYEKGEIEAHPAMRQAYEMGKNV